MGHVELGGEDNWVAKTIWSLGSRCSHPGKPGGELPLLKIVDW